MREQVMSANGLVENGDGHSDAKMEVPRDELLTYCNLVESCLEQFST
jgi:hypothetical protein